MIDLDEARAVREAATQGEWLCGLSAAEEAVVVTRGASVATADRVDDEAAKADARFIAYAANNWSAIIAELAAAREALAWRPIETCPVSPEALHLRQWVLFALRVRPYQSQKWCVGFCELDDDGERRYVNDYGHTIDFALNKEEAIAWRPLPTLPQDRSND